MRATGGVGVNGFAWAEKIRSLLEGLRGVYELMVDVCEASWRA